MGQVNFFVEVKMDDKMCDQNEFLEWGDNWSCRNDTSKWKPVLESSFSGKTANLSAEVESIGDKTWTG